MIQNAAAEAINGDSARTAIAAVFQNPQYHRTLRQTLWQQLVDWFVSLFRAVNGVLHASPLLRWLVIASLVAVALLVVGRALYAREARRPALSFRKGSSYDTIEGDPWYLAQAEARAGRYLEAAHALYLAVLQSLARSDRIVVDSAKTVGDYSRDLRRSASSSLPLYRSFARVYEPVVWGTRRCDREYFDRLSAIATELAGR